MLPLLLQRSYMQGDTKEAGIEVCGIVGWAKVCICLLVPRLYALHFSLHPWSGPVGHPSPLSSGWAPRPGHTCLFQVICSLLVECNSVPPHDGVCSLQILLYSQDLIKPLWKAAGLPGLQPFSFRGGALERLALQGVLTQQLLEACFAVSG
mgnify:CR=1 FL=1